MGKIFRGLGGGGPQIFSGCGGWSGPSSFGAYRGGSWTPEKECFGCLGGFSRSKKYFWGYGIGVGSPFLGEPGGSHFGEERGGPFLGGDLWSHFWEGKGVVFPREEWEVSIFGWAVRAEFLGVPFFGLVLEILF